MAFVAVAQLEVAADGPLPNGGGHNPYPGEGVPMAGAGDGGAGEVVVVVAAADADRPKELVVDEAARGDTSYCCFPSTTKTPPKR